MFGSGNTFDPNTDIPDLSGKVYVVTGGSAGIGFGLCAHILQHNPAALYLLGKKEEHIQEATEGLKKFGDVSQVHSVQIELEDLKQTDQVAKELASKLDRLDGLICNAGLGVGVFNLTKDGIDSHMQVNHIAQFHLSRVLLPLLQKTPNSRLVLQSSEMHRAISDAKFESLAELNTDIGPTKLYNRTKLALVLYIRALAERKEKGQLGFDPDAKTGPWLNATHPGAVSTDQQKQAEDAYGTLGKVGVSLVRPFMKDPVDQGCRAALFAATGEDVVKDAVQGQYIMPDRKPTSPSGEAQNHELQENLWKLTEKILVDKLGSVPYETQYV
ncbi:SDR family oxidoreductase [Aspergillus undulatus]|uniref:SDR family oxidoreductase n=1 Tax=Aspergillus undulatus TaxID=1810928 RepID=UPI003CCDD00F